MTVPCSTRTRTQGRGVTLVELMVTVAVLVTLVRLATPSYRSFVLNQRLSTAASDFLSTLLQARSEAMRLGKPVLVVPLQEIQGPPATRFSWLDGWCVFVDHDNSGQYSSRATLVGCAAQPDLRGLLAVVTGSGKTSGPFAIAKPYFSYNPLGFAKVYPNREAGATTPNGSLWLQTLASGGVASRERAIIVSRAGRPRLCDPGAGSGATPCSTG